MGEPADALVGTVLDGRYRVTRRLARGGMATVYEAVDTRLDRGVAVKVMHPALAEDKDFVERFIREARSAARLSHPNVVSVFDQSADSGAVFLAMEYVEGRTLRDWLRDKGRLTPRETFAVMEPVLAALAAAHSAGLVHRDIKPENVLIADDGRVKVADFGLARAVTAGANTATWGAPTGTNTLIGTVAYLSPEQVEKGHADQRSDVYAAGILLYECLTGLQPFSGESPIQVAYQHVHYDVPRPSEVRPTLPPALDNLVLRSTARDPDGRPADAGAFLAETVAVRRTLRPEVLDDLAGGAPGAAPVPAPAPAQGSPTLMFGQVPPGAAAGPDAVTAAIRRPGPAGPPAGSPPGRPAAAGVPLAVPARLQRRRRRGFLALLAVLVTTFAVGIGAWQVAVGSSVTTPSLLNLTREEALVKAEEAGLKVRFAEEEHDELVPKGQVLRTDPQPGRKISESGTIVAVLSAGPERYAVPDLAGETVEDAKKRLAENNLTVADEQGQKYSDSVPEGRVLATDPPAGKELRRDAVVKLIVSRGAKPISVPDVVGRSLQEATDLLTSAGFKATWTEQVDDSVPSGTVLSQNPGPNRKLSKGSTIELVVSKSDLVEVPRVIGMDVDDAEDLLESLGFDVDVRRSLFGGDRVVSQDPEPGSRVPPGTRVTLRVF
ncbi:Stk1 family PASTA domain-containing Ser/Thr kinase [Sporichthya polymorpha]|uniref:Stk1 family PASTA domain-containing Ser/Thr kinase n=1 Tax=Sporichthya polymorpha TaxID=35751 RepID=UPI00035C7818|nr:Stk1 family PASTA domain-containing Ser/Thr kinase [Sporichthya polymorpha]